MSEQTATTVAAPSVAADASGTRDRMVRAITMKFFHGGIPAGQTKPRDLAFEVLSEAKKDKPVPVVAGVVVGRISGFKEKIGKLPDGTQLTSILLTGAFEATRSSDGATMEAPGMYLPPLFSDYAQAALNGGAKAVDFAIEVCVEKNPRPGGVAYVWVIHNLLRQVETTPLDRIKAQMQKHSLVVGSGEPVKAAIAAPEPEAASTSGMMIDHDPETGEIKQTDELVTEATQQAAVQEAHQKGKGKKVA